MADPDRFVVHNPPARQTLYVPALTDTGRSVMAPVEGLVVELVPKDGFHGTITRRYLPDNEDELRELETKYKVGTEILVITAIAADQPARSETPQPEQRRSITAEDTQTFAPEHPQVTIAGGAMVGERDAQKAAEVDAAVKAARN